MPFGNGKSYSRVLPTEILHCLMKFVSNVMHTRHAKINHALLTGHDISYTGPILTIYELIFS